MAAALWNRCSGSIASARRTTPATSGETQGARPRTGGAGVEQIARMSLPTDSTSRNGARPASAQ
jgi:hypothetical protein